MVAITGCNALPAARRIVVKVGSALLVDEDKNTINTAWLAGIASDIARLKVAGKMLWWSRAVPLHWEAGC